MRPPLKLNSIDQEHLQELYNAAGVARDELPYTEKFDEIWEGFQDRTFKNAEKEQLYAAMLKYTRSSGNAAAELPASNLTEEQVKQLKIVLSRHVKAGKILPFSEEFDHAHREFIKVSGSNVTQQEFWHGILRAQGSRRKPPTRKKVAVAKAEDDGSDEDGE
ncbi:MAG TPA: hypothetical protein VGN72_01465 [Tepidisphaeraceae bacterium]|jgi:hypothetical protein|nr:hypothetical protein [Tepidisphaeraceae bacterium]